MTPNSPLISVIIPVYNSADVVSACLQSVLKQSFQSFELIIVNDGSTDQSYEICAEMAAKDSRINLISIPNGGAANARNTGLSVATGKYIAFIDSDDYVLKDYLSSLYDDVSHHITDMVVHSVIKVADDNEEQLNIPSLFVPHEQANIWLETISGVSGMWAKLYVREIIALHNITFNAGLIIAEDLLFNITYAAYAKRGIYFNNIHNYHYIIHPGSLMTSNRAKTYNNSYLIFAAYLSAIQAPLFNDILAHLDKYPHIRQQLTFLAETFLESSGPPACTNRVQKMEQLYKLNAVKVFNLILQRNPLRKLYLTLLSKNLITPAVYIDDIRRRLDTLRKGYNT